MNLSRLASPQSAPDGEHVEDGRCHAGGRKIARVFDLTDIMEAVPQIWPRLHCTLIPPQTRCIGPVSHRKTGRVATAAQQGVPRAQHLITHRELGLFSAWA